MAKSLDLTALLPKQYRDMTIDTLVKNLFERHVSKDDTVTLYGNIGDGELDAGEIKITEKTLERQVNQITSMIYAEHASEKLVYSWPDLVQKMVLMGIDYSTIGEWFKTTSYNFMPPVDIDKFCNFQEYFWIGPWIQKAPNLPYHMLGIPSISYVTDAFARTNSSYYPEYYTIKRSGLTPNDYLPVSPAPNLKTWSDWGLTNLWVHKQDMIDFVNQYGNFVSFSDVSPATRPIVEYYDTLRLNTAQNAQGEPIESVNNNRIIQKMRANQPPLFDVYDRFGRHYGKTSAIFYYVEGSSYPVDAVIQRRLATDANNDFLFEHSLVDQDTSELIFFKQWDGAQFNLRTIWTPGPEDAPRYVKYDSSGTLINQDKFVNYRNYYWKAVAGECEPYNPTAEPQYTVIEAGANGSDWSIYNKWVHVSQLKLAEIPLYVQASRPIVEFNKYLESELIEAKGSVNQLPRFRMYAYDTTLSAYALVGHAADASLANLNDAYLRGSAFVRIADLDANLQTAITTTPELMAKVFTYGDDQYLQSLDTGMFVAERDGNVYGYRADVITTLDPTKGSVESMSIDAVCVPEVIVLTYDLATNLFNVTGSVSGQNPDLIPGSVYDSNTGLHFTVSIGTTPFAHGDQILLNVKGYVYQDENLYVKVDGEYRTLTDPSKILETSVDVVKVDADPKLRDGVWEVPPQVTWNVSNETRTQIKQGDLYFHLTSIIREQPGLLGSETGNNNFRLLPSRNLGLGGIIKQYDGQTALLVSMLLQEGLSVPTIIEFARRSYENLFSSIHRFVEDVIPTMLTDVDFVPPQVGDDTIDSKVVDAFKEYFLGSTSTKYPDFESASMQSVFADSTSPIKGVVATLPYLGLCQSVAPVKELDLELNLPMLVHHDGHRSKLASVDMDMVKAIVKKRFIRASGQESTGFVSAIDFPKNPRKGQFWFQTSTSKLFFYNVVSDSGELPATAPIGAYSVNRETGQIWQYNGVWNQLGVYETNEPWLEVRLDLIEQNLTLAIEKELYDGCPPVAPRLNEVAFESDDAFIPNMKKELERFGVIYGTPDVYGSVYNSANPFTWNYYGITGGDEVWSEVYKTAYGTPRPDIQPWIPAGYASELDLMTDLSYHGLVQMGNLEWDVNFWTVAAIAEFIRQKYVANGHPSALCVDTYDGTFLPPYSVYAEGLYKTVPTTASDPFTYGGLGPVELFWRKTLNYLYSKQKTYFKINPLEYVNATWGVRYDTVGNYVLNASLGRKEGAVDTQLHGDPIPAKTDVEKINEYQTINSMLSATVIQYPESPRTYVVSCVNRKDALFSIVSNGALIGYVNPGSVFTDDAMAIYISPLLTSFYWGDSFTVELGVDGVPAVSHAVLPYIHIEGLNQWYVQYRRLYGEDISLSINQTLLKDWKVRAGYRLGGLINTDSLTVTNQNEVMDPSTYDVLIKENKFYASSWLNALKIQLVQKGSSVGGMPRPGPGGSPGEDWIFRVDNFNDLKTDLSWYTFDETGSYTDFIVLDGKKTLYPWKHYGDVSGLVTFNTPFLIKGIQNVASFLFGYAAKLEADGWRFNDQANPVLDPKTGRPVGFQLLVEQFINQQFSIVDAGSTFVVNPFSRKVWFYTAHGVVADLYTPLGLEREVVCSILGQDQRPLAPRDLRVFRRDDQTEIVFDKPAYTLHVLLSEYEHVILFDDYTVGSLLVNDAFLGQRADKIFLSGEKQSTFTGRLDFGGHYVLGDEMKKNIESSVASIITMYDTSSNSYGPEVDRARALLGFQKKPYFTARGSTDATQFRFWQGMISSKGTNYAVDAYVNSSQYQSAKLDEYWAYKLAEYGDAREIKKVELKVEPIDCTAEITKYLLLEDDEIALIKAYKKNGGYDIANMGIDAYDVATLYTAIQSVGFDYVDPTGCTIIRPDDESRWFGYDDLKAIEYFDSVPIAEFTMVADSLDKIYVITDKNGERVRADCFEIVDLSDPEMMVYYEVGSISDSDPFDMSPYDTNPYDQLIQTARYPEYDPPLFKRLNHHSIQILDPLLLNRPLKVIAYGPAFSRYSPSSLIDYKNNTLSLDDIIWWDPARGSHHPLAINEVDYVQDKNPAKYNVSLATHKNTSINQLRPWGDEHVGKIWWNTAGLEYQPYSDTKIVTDMNDRVASWGAISDASTMEVYEWVKSTIPPDEYDTDPTADGNPAFRDVITRTRTWYQRPVAWKYSPNPLRSPRVFSAYQPSRMRVEVISGVEGRAILNTGDFISVLTRGCKFAGATYMSQAKTDAQLVDIFGTALITSDPYVVMGSKSEYTSGAVFSTNPYFTVTAELDQRVLALRTKNYLGEYSITGEQDGGDFYVRMTHVDSGETQRLVASDFPVLANTQCSYNFDHFGIVIICTSKMARDELVGMNEITRKEHTILSIGLAHELYLRSAVDISIMAPFSDSGMFYLDGIQDVSRNGWIGWKDPEENPNIGLEPPLNRYEPFVGDWTVVQGHLADLADDIRIRLADPWTWFNGRDFNPYMGSWSSWSKIENVVVNDDYFPVTETHDEYIMNRFTFQGLLKDDLKARGSLFINEVQMLPSQWSTATRVNGPTVVGSYITTPTLNPGDRIKFVLRPITVTEDELKFDPDVEDNIFKLVQYKVDYPHVLDEKRDQSDRKTHKYYYFWVKNKLSPPKNKSMSVSKVSDLLHHHDGTYAIPQIFKHYSQVDGRPNRYASIAVRGLGMYVAQDEMYKIRFTDNGTLRTSDDDLSLKNRHVEWALLRPGQTTKIPKSLWDKLTDTLIGKTADGRTLLPFTPLQKYDDRNGTNNRFGFGSGQVMDGSLSAIATIKYTIQNTRVDKYSGAALVPDYISYDGFDINNLDNYFFDPVSGNLDEDRVRQFMSNLWRFAKPKQINEIFFAVLEDTAAKNLEISDFFKTSFISVGEIRTIN